MAKSQDTFSKKEKEKKRLKKKQDKQAKKEDRQANSTGGDLESMLVYVDENGYIVDTPPNPLQRVEIDADSIELGIPRRTAEVEETVKTGKVEFFNDSKGFGFIKDSMSSEKYFVHINSVTGVIKENDKVTFETERGPKGLNAVNVKKA